MIKYVCHGKELKIGDVVGVNVTLTASGRSYKVGGTIKILPENDATSFAVDLGGYGCANIIFPKLEDLSGVSISIPDNWPPQENDVWSGRYQTWHYLHGELTTNRKTNRVYREAFLPEFLANNPDTKLLYRHKD